MHSYQYRYRLSSAPQHHPTTAHARTRPLPSPEPTYPRVSITPDPPSHVKPNPLRYTPYKLSPAPSTRQPNSYPDKNRHRSQHNSAPRSMLERKLILPSNSQTRMMTRVHIRCLACYHNHRSTPRFGRRSR